MKRTANFGFRLSPQERVVLASLARRLDRSESDAIRWLIRQAGLALACTSRERQPDCDKRDAQAAGKEGTAQ